MSNTLTLPVDYNNNFLPNKMTKTACLASWQAPRWFSTKRTTRLLTPTAGDTSSVDGDPRIRLVGLLSVA